MDARIWQVELFLISSLLVLAFSFPNLENPPFSQSVTLTLFKLSAELSQNDLYPQVWQTSSTIYADLFGLFSSNSLLNCFDSFLLGPPSFNSWALSNLGRAAVAWSCSSNNLSYLRLKLKNQQSSLPNPLAFYHLQTQRLRII